jgi:hypothetical protein
MRDFPQFRHPKSIMPVAEEKERKKMPGPNYKYPKYKHSYQNAATPYSQTSQRNGVLDDLPPDALTHAGDFIAGWDAHNMGMLSRTTRRALEGKPVGYTVTEANIDQLIWDITRVDRIVKPVTMGLILPEFPPGLREKMFELYREAPHVRSLDITVRRQDIEDREYKDVPDSDEDVAQVIRSTLATLASFTPRLEKLQLDFSSFASSHVMSRFTESVGVYIPRLKVGIPGSVALSGLNMAPALRSLRLELNGNEIGDDGAAALKSLRFAPALEYLYLGLGNNRIGPQGVLDLVELRTSPVLQVLELELENNHIGDRGALHLATLARADYTNRQPPSVLHTLILGMKNNRIRDDGAHSLGFTLVHRVSTSLHTVHLNLEWNMLAPETRDYLRELSKYDGSRAHSTINLRNIKVKLNNNYNFDGHAMMQD